LRIMETDSGDATMASLAAGPLEYLLTTHGKDVIDRLEARPERTPPSDACWEVFGGMESRTPFGAVSRLFEMMRGSPYEPR
jgi:hypothetical protein